jgi:hypothetical protein
MFLLEQYWLALTYSVCVLLYRLGERRRSQVQSPATGPALGAGETGGFIWALQFSRSTDLALDAGHSFIIPGVLAAIAQETLLEMAPLAVILVLDFIGRQRSARASVRVHLVLVLAIVTVLCDRLLSVALWLGRMAQAAKDAGLQL